MAKIARFGFEWNRVPSMVTLSGTTTYGQQGRFSASPGCLIGGTSAACSIALSSATSVFGTFFLLSTGAYPATTNIVTCGLVTCQIVSGTSIVIIVNSSTVATITLPTALTQGSYFGISFAINLATSGGSVTFVVDGSTVTWTGNTVTTSVNTVAINFPATTLMIDDIAINDNTTSVDNTLPPFVRCGKSMTTGGGTSQTWTPTGTIAPTGAETTVATTFSTSSFNASNNIFTSIPLMTISNTYLISDQQQHINEIDPNTNTVTATNIAQPTTGAIVDYVYLPSYNRLYILWNNYNLSANQTTLVVYDQTTKTKITTLSFGGVNTVTGLSMLYSSTTGKIYICGLGGSVTTMLAVGIFDPSNNGISYVKSGTGTFSAYPGYACFNGSGNIILPSGGSQAAAVIFNTSNNSFSSVTTIGGLCSGAYYQSSTNESYLLANTSGNIYVVNPTTLAAITTISTTCGVMARAIYCPSTGYICFSGSTGVCAVNPSTHAVVWTQSITGALPLTWDNTNSVLYVGATSSISLLNGSTGSVLNAITTSYPCVAVAGPYAGRIYFFANNTPPVIYAINQNNFIFSTITSPTAAQAAVDQGGAIVTSTFTPGSVSNFVLQPSTTIWPSFSASSFQGANITATNCKKTNTGSKALKVGVAINGGNIEIGADAVLTTTNQNIQRTYLPPTSGTGSVTLSQADSTLQTYLETN